MRSAAARHENAARALEAGGDERVSLSESASDPGSQFVLADDHGCIPGYLHKCVVPHGHNRRATCHRLEDRQAEALVQRRLHETRGSPVELGQLGDVDVAAHRGAALAEMPRKGGVLLRADDDERQPDLLRCLERRELILARLDGADREHVVVGATLPRPEDRVDTVRRHDDSGGIEAVQLDEVLLRALRHREHPDGPTRRAWHDAPEDEAVAATHQLHRARTRDRGS